MEELRRHANLLWPLMAVHRHHFAYLTCFVLLLDEIPHGAVAAIPGGLIIDDHGNTAASGRALDDAGVIHADCQRLFHHHGNVALRAGLHHHWMIVGAGERGYGFRLSVVQHDAEVSGED